MNPALEKIRKLLRMRRGGTPDEIATALAMAQRIAEKEGIDLSQVDPDAEPESQAQPIRHALSDPKARFAMECKCAALVVSQFFHVETLWLQTGYRQFRLVFIGNWSDIEISRYVYAFLVAEFRRRYKRLEKRVRNRQAFMWGAYGGLCHTLRERQRSEPHDQVPGLVVATRSPERRRNYLQEHWPQATDHNIKPDSDARKSELQGYMAGRSISIRQGLNTPGPSAARLENN